MLAVWGLLELPEVGLTGGTERVPLAPPQPLQAEHAVSSTKHLQLPHAAAYRRVPLHRILTLMDECHEIPRYYEGA